LPIATAIPALSHQKRDISLAVTMPVFLPLPFDQLGAP
jgi:hypothetical protein